MDISLVVLAVGLLVIQTHPQANCNRFLIPFFTFEFQRYVTALSLRHYRKKSREASAMGAGGEA